MGAGRVPVNPRQLAVLTQSRTNVAPSRSPSTSAVPLRRIRRIADRHGRRYSAESGVIHDKLAPPNGLTRVYSNVCTVPVSALDGLSSRFSPYGVSDAVHSTLWRLQRHPAAWSRVRIADRPTTPISKPSRRSCLKLRAQQLWHRAVAAITAWELRSRQQVFGESNFLHRSRSTSCSSSLPRFRESPSFPLLNCP